MKRSVIDLETIRHEYRKAPQFSAGKVREATIVKLYYTKTKYSIGVQYWTAAELEAGETTNSDGTKSEFVAMLYVGANPVTTIK